MTPLEQELNSMKRRFEQQIRMDVDEIEQAEQLIQRNRQRIARNEQLLEELRVHEKIHER